MTAPLHLFAILADDATAHAIRAALEAAGHHVTRCRAAADALIVLGHSPFDLVLIDHGLPDASGTDLVRRLGRESISLPVVLLLDPGDGEVALRALHEGFDPVVKDAAGAYLAELPRRVAESAGRHRLQQSNDLLVQALESAKDGIMTTDLHGVILHVNHALEEMTGYPRGEMIGRPVSLLKSGRHAPEFYRELWQTVLARRSWQGEIVNRRKDGSHYEAAMTVSPIVDAGGRLTHFVGLQRDVTQHKQMQRQLLQAQKMKSIGTLAGGVAHEFNNLLAGISGYASLGLLEEDVTPAVRDTLRHVVALTERAAGLTRQLLTFARTPALARKPTSLVALVRQTADLVRHTLHIAVGMDLSDAPPGEEDSAFVVEADANQLQQALVNLTLNARDAVHDREQDGGTVPRPPIVFRVRDLKLTTSLPAFPQTIPPGEYVMLQVEDFGCGMPPAVLAQALDPFFTTKDVGAGTGLGLSVVLGVVQGHQGYLTLRSTPGQGTSISLFIPRRPPTPLPAPAPPPSLEGSLDLEPDLGDGYSILLIDDEEAVLDVMRRFLQIAGHEVTAATSAEQGLRLLRDGLQAHLVVLDLLLSREQNAQVVEQLRREFAAVPVLLCTGGPAEELPAAARRPGCSVIQKPFRMNELWYAVRRALQPE